MALASAAVANPFSQTWEESNPSTAHSLDKAATLSLPSQPLQSFATPILTSPAVEPPIAVNLATLPNLIANYRANSHQPESKAANRTHQAKRGLRGPSSTPVPSYSVVLRAERYFDNSTNNYRLVNKVEVLTYRKGYSYAYPKKDTYENYAGYSTYDVYLRDLKPGDRYEARITWDDGSYRIIERSIDRYPEANVRVSEPL